MSEMVSTYKCNICLTSCHNAESAGLFLFADRVVRPTQYRSVMVATLRHIRGHRLGAVVGERPQLPGVHRVVEQPPERHVGVGLGVHIARDVHPLIAGHAVDDGLSRSAYRCDWSANK